jgi:hypothetical protein
MDELAAGASWAGALGEMRYATGSSSIGLATFAARLSSQVAPAIDASIGAKTEAGA